MARLVIVFVFLLGTLPVDAAERIEIVFVLDSTGSMSSMLSAAKVRVWSIVSEIGQVQPAPHLRLGLLNFRDRGDPEVTHLVPLTDELDRVFDRLSRLTASGGGDGPESVNQALAEAIDGSGWTAGAGTLRLLFLIGDAPPHMDYRDDVPYTESVPAAVNQGIVIHTLQCGGSREVEEIWRDIARVGGGQYLRVPQGGRVASLTTPYDKRLAIHGRMLDRTVVPYGDAERRAELESRRERAERLGKTGAAEALADRAIYRASEAGLDEMAGEGDLVRDVRDGKVKLDQLDEGQLPESMRELELEQRRHKLELMAEQRRGLLEEIAYLAEQRRKYLEENLSRDQDDLDRQVLEVLRTHDVNVPE